MGVESQRVSEIRPDQLCDDASELMTASLLPVYEVAAGVAAWELLFIVSGALLAIVCRGDGQTIVAIADASERAKATTKLVEQGPSYVCAFIHACIVGVRGVSHIYALFGAPIAVQLALPPESHPLHAAVAGTMTTNVIFLSWLIYDVQHLVRSYPKLGGVDTIAHHCGFIGVSLLCGHYGIMCFQFAWLITGELSSIALNIRWALIATGRGDTAMLKAANVLFALAFFVTRVLLYGLGLVHLLRNHAALGSLEGVRPSLVLFIVTMLAAGYGLNLMWMSKIVKMASGQPRPRGGKKEQ